MKIHLLVIDPQNDFCDPNGSLFVPGADEDIKRLAEMVHRLKDKLDDQSKGVRLLRAVVFSGEPFASQEWGSESYSTA